jgi:predicted phosphoribosyltransferase
MEGIAKTKEGLTACGKVSRKSFPDLRRPVILVDDGIASGFTLLTAVEALKKAACREIILAVPTAHEESLTRILEEVNVVYCPNVRGGWSFAVADAYEHWRDLKEEEVVNLLEGFNKGLAGLKEGDQTR